MQGASSSLAELPLRDIHLPPPPGFWPPAPGWWALAVLTLLLAAALVLLARRRRRLAYRRQALRELAALEKNEALGPSALLAALSALLRRALLCGPGGAACAALTGEAWLRHLDGGLKGEPFSTGPGRVLEQGPYRLDCDFDRRALFELCRRRLQKLPAASKKGRRP